MEIIYKEGYTDSVITEQQAIAGGEYDQVFLENGIIKKLHRYDNSILEFIEYHISADENEAELVENLTPLASIALSIIEPKEPLGIYFVERDDIKIMF